MIFPKDNNWTQLNEGDTRGILHRTRNIDLNTPGKVKLNHKTHTLFDNSSLNLGYVTSIVYFNNTYYAVGTESSGIIAFDLEGNVAGATGSEPTLSIYGDAIVANSLVWISIADNVYTYSGSTYTDRSATLTASVPHPIEIFDSLTTYKIAIGDDNGVHMMDYSYNEAGTDLVLPSKYIVTSLAYNNGFLYVGTRNRNGGDAAIFVWNGSTANADTMIPVSGNWVYSVKPYKNTVAAILSSGELVVVNGAATSRLGALPVFYDQNVIWQGTLDSDVPRVFHRGMRTDGDDIYLNVNALIDSGLSSDYYPGFETGIWQYTPTTGLNHFAASTRDIVVTDTGLSVTSSLITTSAAHNLKSGDSVVFSATNGLSGVSTLVKYYALVQSSTTLYLCTSRDGVKNGNYVTITGTADSGDILEYSPNTEYYQYARVSSGAIIKPTAHDTYFKHWSTPIIWGASVQDEDIATRRYGVHALMDGYNIGFIETQRIYSNSPRGTFKELYTFIDGLNLDVEEAVLKYRTKEELDYPSKAFLGVWLSTTQINSLPANYDEFDWNYIKVGDEIMIVDGTGRGKSAHVTAVEESSNTFTLTLDEAIGVTNDTCRIVATNYQKVDPVMTNAREFEDSFKSVLGDKKGSWIQFKLELRGYQTKVNRFFLSEVGNKNAV